MIDPYPQQSIEWLDWYSQQYGAPQKDPSAVPRLTRTIADYLHWMKSVNYTPASRHQHRMQLELFLDFVKNRRLHWQQLFTVKTREHFKKISGLATTAAVNGLSRYLVEHGSPGLYSGTATLRDYCLLHLLFDSGARATEIATLNLDYFDCHNQTLAILGKGNRFRQIELWPKTCELLTLYIQKYRSTPRPQYCHRLCRKYLKRVLPPKRLNTINP